MITRLSNSTVGLVPTKVTPACVLLTGGLTLAHDEISTRETALCTIIIGSNWQVSMPRVICYEPWLRQELDWHVPWGRRLCLDLQERWTDFIGLAGMIVSPRHLEEYAADYLLHSTRWLLYRHLYGYQNNITIWPKEWGGWGHGLIGPQEYKNQLRKNVTQWQKTN